MILVDTSVLMSFLKDQKNQTTAQFDYILDKKIPYGITTFIYQEILQRAKTDKEYRLLKEYFETILLYHLKYGKASYEQAALLNIRCKQKGIIIRSTIKLLIAETAIENNLYLLHNDNDFINIAAVIKELKLYK
ncbi:MAG: type II toxin-antitoxin system VapC family toxin [Treponema sp.]|uniref:type II toxin-antitoxin system VapC family toxin n=1 Tax=Treponema sp. TaxID=166 RepID=UPI003FA3341E